MWFFGGESGVNLDTITSSAVPVQGLQTRRAGRWKTIADACALPGGGGADGLENMLEYRGTRSPGRPVGRARGWSGARGVTARCVPGRRDSFPTADENGDGNRWSCN